MANCFPNIVLLIASSMVFTVKIWQTNTRHMAMTVSWCFVFHFWKHHVTESPPCMPPYGSGAVVLPLSSRSPADPPSLGCIPGWGDLALWQGPVKVPPHQGLPKSRTKKRKLFCPCRAPPSPHSAALLGSAVSQESAHFQPRQGSRKPKSVAGSQRRQSAPARPTFP